MSQFFQSFRDYELRSTGKWFALAAAIGVVSGVGAIAFQFLGQVVQHFVLTGLTGFQPGEASGEHAYFEHHAGTLIPWAIVAVMAGGGLVSGFLVYTFAPEAEGHGTDAAIDSFHNRRGAVRYRIPIIKTLASAVTLGTGGSAGREGPIAQIGAGFGSFLASQLKLPARDRRILLATGMGAGVGAIFRAPLAGALFAGEILYSDADLEADVIVPSAVSSIVAYCVYSLSLPAHVRFTPLFGLDEQFEFVSLSELVPYTLLAAILTVAGVLYIKTFYGTHKLFQCVPVPKHFRPLIGAAIAGLTGLGLYYAMGKDINALAVLGSGYGTLQEALSSSIDLSVTLLMAVALVKIVTTSMTISSGGSGGVFGPSMVIGGCVGAATGKLFDGWWPNLVSNPEAFAIVGMAGFFAGCARAPFSTILMVTEMTGDYKLLLPTMWVSTLCFLLGARWTLYEKQVPTRLDSPAHRGDFLVDVLEGMCVDDVYNKERNPVTVFEGATLDQIVHNLAETSQRYFPVVDANGGMIGIFSAEDVRGYLYNDEIWDLATASDVMTSRVVTVSPDDDLNTALKRFTALNISELPVVSPSDPQRLVGVLRHKDVIGAYNRRLAEHKSAG
ncbi:MAG: chloride channel protein [Planctomycetales bacterium]|nr:chloride channel protein [Planctomycetales bacterium]